MKKSFRRTAAFVLALTLVVGTMPANVGGFLTGGTGIVAKAYDNNPYTDFIPTANDSDQELTAKQVTFGGKQWHIIKDESTSATSGTVTLLMATNFDNKMFDENSNVYANSWIKTALGNLTTDGSFKKFADVIKDTDNGKFYLLSDTEAAEVPQNLRKAFNGDAWWLRTQGTGAGNVKYVYVNDDKQNNHGRIVASGISPNTIMGVRPALQLDLSKVVFDATSKTFHLPATAPTVNSVTGTTLVNGYTFGRVSVSATAPTGHTLSYQWYSNTTNSNEGGTKIEGATSDKYNIETGKDTGTYYYYCVVTATRTDNSQTASISSSVAAVTVAADTDALIAKLAQDKNINLNNYYLIPAEDMYYTSGEHWSKGDVSGRHTNSENEHYVATKQFTIQGLPEDSVIFCKPYYSINVAATDSAAISETIGKANYLLTTIQSEFSQWTSYKYFGINLTKYVEGNFNTKTEMTSDDLEHMSDIFRIYVPRSEAVAKIGDNSYSTLADAVRAAQAGDTIVLQRDATDNLVLTAGKEIIFDLNGHKLTNDGKHNTIITQIGSKLTLTDSSSEKTGKVDNTENQRAPIFNNGGTVILNGGTITRSAEAGYDGGNTYYTVVNHGTMTINEGVKIENDTVNYSSLIANGYNAFYSPNKQQIDPDIIAGYQEGVNAVHPTLTINGGTFKGGNQALKNDVNGIANISGGSFSSSTGNAVYNVGELTISGGEFTANTEGKFALRSAAESGKTYGPASAAGSATVTGGTFTGAVVKDEGATVSVSGGAFSQVIPENCCAEGFTFPTTKDESGKYVVLPNSTVKTQPSAKNPTHYSSPVQLINAGTAENGTMYYMISDVKPDKDDSSWNSDVSTITANAAGTYKVWYKVIGNANYADVPVCDTPVEVTVTQYTAPTPTYYSQSWTLTMDSYEYDGTAHTPAINGRAYTYSYTQIQYTYYNADTNEELDGAPSAIGNYKVKVYADGGSSYYGRTQTATYSITDPIDANGMAKVDAFKENDTVPVSDGKVFAGWFTDETCTTAYTENTGKAYAKFIDEKILTVKAQISSGTTANSASTSIRFITSVDSLKYQNVGFKITCNGKTIDRKMTKVYTAINAGGAKVKSTVFSKDSKYMEAYTLNNITKDDYGKEFTVTPYYTTQDGTIVEGKTNTFTIANMIK